MPKDYSDYSFLLKCLKNGDEDAFRYLYVTSRNRLFALANSIIDDEESSRDLVQEFFADLLQTYQFQNITTALKTYLYNSVRNRALKFIREKAAKSKRRTDFEKHLNTIHNQHDIFEIENHLDQQNLSTEIETTVFGLPPMARKVFIMHYIQSMSHSQIAEKLNISKNTVVNHMSRALKELREQLKKNLQ